MIFGACESSDITIFQLCASVKFWMETQLMKLGMEIVASSCNPSVQNASIPVAHLHSANNFKEIVYPKITTLPSFTPNLYKLNRKIN